MRLSIPMLLTLTLTLLPGVSAAAVAPAAAQFLQLQEAEFFSPDEAGRAPSKYQFAMVVTNADFAARSSMDFALWTEYQPESREPNPSFKPKTKIQVTIDLLRGDATIRLGRFSAKKLGTGWEGVYGTKRLDVQALPGDVILWTLDSKKLPLIVDEDQFEITVGVVTGRWVFASAAAVAGGSERLVPSSTR